MNPVLFPVTLSGGDGLMFPLGGSMDRNDKIGLTAFAIMMLTVVALAIVHAGTSNSLANPPPDSKASRVEEQRWENEPPRDFPAQRHHILGDSWAQWLMMGFTGAATIISGVAVYIVNETLKTSRSATNAAVAANRTTRQMGIAQVRAYVGLVDLKGHTDPKNEAFEVSFSMCNTGQTPARSINVRAWLVRIDRDGNRVLTQRSRTYDDPADLIPGERRPIFWERVEFWEAVNLTYSPTTLAAYKALETEYYIEGWVFYETVLEEYRRETRFRYRVTGWNDRASALLNFHRTEDGNYAT